MRFWPSFIKKFRPEVIISDDDEWTFELEPTLVYKWRIIIYRNGKKMGYEYTDNENQAAMLAKNWRTNFLRNEEELHRVREQGRQKF